MMKRLWILFTLIEGIIHGTHFHTAATIVLSLISTFFILRWHSNYQRKKIPEWVYLWKWR